MMIMNNRIKIITVCLLVVFFFNANSETIGPWNLDTLYTVPEWEESSLAPEDGMTSILYKSVDYEGNPVQVFAYYNAPDGTMPEGGWPAAIYAHGGGGTAIPAWINYWNDRGYAAITMDLEGRCPATDEEGAKVYTPNPGPKRVGVWDDYQEPIKEQWYYHAVSQIILAHTLIASFPEVNAEKIGLTGTSWGGTLTSTVMGVDSRLAWAIPVYGAGFLSESDGHQGDALAAGAETEFVNANYDGLVYFKNVTFPTLWINGTNDNHFSMTCTQESSRAVNGPAILRYSRGFGHSNTRATTLDELYVFADQVVNGGVPLVSMGRPHQYSNKVAVSYESSSAIVSAKLVYTLDDDQWEYREWFEAPASVSNDSILADVPDSAIAVFFELTDARDLMVTSEYVEFKLEKEVVEEVFYPWYDTSTSDFNITFSEAAFATSTPNVTNPNRTIGNANGVIVDNSFATTNQLFETGKNAQIKFILPTPLLGSDISNTTIKIKLYFEEFDSLANTSIRLYLSNTEEASSTQIFKGSNFAESSEGKWAEYSFNFSKHSPTRTELIDSYNQISFLFNAGETGNDTFFWDGIYANYEQIGSTSLSDSWSKRKIEIYPNPVLDEIYIKDADKLNITFDIFNLSGLCVHSGQYMKEGDAIDVSFLSPGTYILRLADAVSMCLSQFIKK